MREILFCKTLRNLRKTKHTDGMKKFFCVSTLLAAVWIGSAAGAGLCARAYEGERTVISEKTAVIDGKPVEVRLSGVGKTYITEIRLDVLQGGKPVCSIVPPNDFGFDPFIGFYEFSKDEPFLFYSAQSGGSGGYGFYNVYRLTGEKCRQVYDQAQDSAKNRFAGEFIDGCKMVLQNLNEKNSLAVDVGYMAPEFLKLIFPAGLPSRKAGDKHQRYFDCVSLFQFRHGGLSTEYLSLGDGRRGGQSPGIYFAEFRIYRR